MRIVAWNLGHQTREKAIPTNFGACVEGLYPDVLVLNEYVHGPTRTGMSAHLGELGLTSVEISERFERHNQVLIASRFPLERGDLKGPGDTPLAQSNFLPVRLHDRPLEIVGMRVPAFKRAADKAAYWQDLVRLVSSVADRPILFTGDLNANPSKGRTAGDKALARLRADGWHVPEPEGPWSFWRAGKISRVDHVVAAPRVGVSTARYVASCGDHALAGRPDSVSDHAALVVEIA